MTKRISIVSLFLVNILIGMDLCILRTVIDNIFNRTRDNLSLYLVLCPEFLNLVYTVRFPPGRRHSEGVLNRRGIECISLTSSCFALAPKQSSFLVLRSQYVHTGVIKWTEVCYSDAS